MADARAAHARHTSEHIRRSTNPTDRARCTSANLYRFTPLLLLLLLQRGGVLLELPTLCEWLVSRAWNFQKSVNLSRRVRVRYTTCVATTLSINVGKLKNDNSCAAPRERTRARTHKRGRRTCFFVCVCSRYICAMM